MYKILIITVYLSVCLLVVMCELNIEEGADCEWKGIKGKCVQERICLTSLDQRGEKPPVCSHKGEGTIICCTDCSLVNDTSNFILSPSGAIFWKDGRKSRDACLQYLKDLPHICHQEGYYTGISRSLDTERRCHSFNMWGRGGGSLTKARPLNKNPYEAMLGYGENQDTGFVLSGGAIIHEKFILTSAHRLSPLTENDPLKYVALGVENWDTSNWQIHKVKQTYKHPQYDGHTRYNDIALVELETPITFNRDVLPACLPEPEEEFNTTKAKFTFWMRDNSEQNKGIYVSKPQSIEAQEVTIDECNAKMEEDLTDLYDAYKFYLPEKIKGDSQVCYRVESNMTLIQTPVVVITQYSRCMNTVVGVKAYGPHNSQTVLTNVKHYTPWIESIVWP